MNKNIYIISYNFVVDINIGCGSEKFSCDSLGEISEIQTQTIG